MTVGETCTAQLRADARPAWRRAGVLLLALALLAGCGSDSNNGGSTGSAITVQISPTALLVNLNQTQQFAFLVTGAPTVDIADTNGAVRAANVVTITTKSAHNLMAGQSVTISGVTDLGFNGIFTVVSVPSSTTFTFAQTAVDASSGSGRVANTTVTWLVNDVAGGNAMVGTITTAGLYTAPAGLPPATTATIASTNGAVRTSNLVTITTTSAHSFVVNQVVQISGVTDTSFNVTAIVTSVPSTTTFTYSQTAANATSGGGTAKSTAVVIRAQSVLDSNARATAIVSVESGVAVRVLPQAGSIGTGESFQFQATVTGNTNQSVNWFVNDTQGGDAMTVGTISATGLYTAPATPPNAVTATITATGAVRASNVVTITTAAAHTFLAGQGVQISGVTDASFNGTFTIASTPSTTTFTYAQTGPDAMSGSGMAVGGATSVTIRASSVVDPDRSATALLLVLAAGDPTLASISPMTAPQGSLFVDVYLTGSNFLTTTVARVNGTPVSSAFVDNTILRARIPANLLFTAGTLQIDAQRQSGATTAAQGLMVQPVRPALVAASPDSGTQGNLGALTVRLNGGYYSPSTVAEFDGMTRAAQAPSLSAGISSATRSINTVTITTAAQHTFTRGQIVQISGVADATFNGTFAIASVPSTTTFTYLQNDLPATSTGGTAALAFSTRQLDVTLNPTDLSTAGLFSVGVRNSAATPPFAAVNLAIQPSATPAVSAPVAVGMQPGAVAINIATGVAVVANRGSNSVSLIDLGSGTVTNTFGVGMSPTGVGVDHLRNLAVVANNGSDDVSIVNLATGMEVGPRLSTSPLKPFAVAVNPLTGLAIVAHQSTNTATVIDLTTAMPSIAGTVSNVNTGANPGVAVEPRLNWGIVTPGGAGAIAIVDLGRRSVLATVSAGAGIRGIGVNTETERALLVDPSASFALLFSVLDQSVTPVALQSTMGPGLGHVAAAVNPLTDLGVVVNSTSNQASVIDLRTPQRIDPPLTVGSAPRAVAIDPARNVAVVVNEGSNDVSIINLGAIRALHITDISPVSVLRAPSDTGPVTLTLTGNGFDGTSMVRLDGDDNMLLMPASVSANGRTLTVDVPGMPSTLLASPRRFAVDVVNAGPVRSNLVGFTVIQTVAVGTAPKAVAIDEQRNLAVVANSGSDNISVVDLATGLVTGTITVGDNPQGVAVLPRAGRAVVTNRDSGNASIVNLATGMVDATVPVGTQPLGVAINQDTGIAVVANNGASSIHAFSAITSDILTTLTVDAQPFAVAFDPSRNLAAVTHAGNNSSNVVLVNISSSPTIAGRVGGAQLPTGITFDPVSDRFLVVSSLANNLLLIDPESGQLAQARVGINPTSVANNFNSGTLVTVNTASNTISVMDFQDRRIRAVLPLSATGQFAVAIHPSSNLAVVVDEGNNRVLLVPLPR